MALANAPYCVYITPNTFASLVELLGACAPCVMAEHTGHRVGAFASTSAVAAPAYALPCVRAVLHLLHANTRSAAELRIDANEVSAKLVGADTTTDGTSSTTAMVATGAGAGAGAGDDAGAPSPTNGVARAQSVHLFVAVRRILLHVLLHTDADAAIGVQVPPPPQSASPDPS